MTALTAGAEDEPMNELQHALTDSGEKSRSPRQCLVTEPC